VNNSPKQLQWRLWWREQGDVRGDFLGGVMSGDPGYTHREKHTDTQIAAIY